MNVRTMVSFEGNDYQSWQVELLSYTHRLVGQVGTLTGLVSVRSRDTVPRYRESIEIIPTRWVSRNQVSKDMYPPYNKPASFCDYFSSTPERDEMVLLVDPDMVFVKPWVVEGTDAIGEDTLYMDPQTRGRKIVPRHCRRHADKVQPVGFPIMIHESQLRLIVDRWHILTEEMRADRATLREAGWVCEMWAFSVAAAECGVEFRVERHCSFSNEGLDPGHSLIHYTYATVVPPNSSGIGYLWDKRHYKPWSPMPVLKDGVPTAGQALHAIVEDYRLARGFSRRV